jgi:type IV secretion system protein VirB2
MKNNSKIIFAITLGLISSVAMAAGAVPANLTNFFTTGTGLFTTLAVAIATAAIIYVGVQLAFGGKRITELMPVLLGAVIVAGAAGFTTWLGA